MPTFGIDVDGGVSLKMFDEAVAKDFATSGVDFGKLLVSC